MFLVLAGACTTTPRVAEPVTLAPTVLLVSLDGFRWDYLDRHNPPTLTSIARRGVRAERLLPVFPTATFPNHYTIATGLYADEHGIVGNEMFDPRNGHRFSLKDPAAIQDSEWWGGEPLWVTAERQGLAAATLFWVGSTTSIGGVKPRDTLIYDPLMSRSARVAKILEWLDRPAGTRPRFLTLYFEDVDSAGHRFGPDSPEVAKAVADVDASLGELRAGLEKRGLLDQLHWIVVSDHGMAAVAKDHFLPIGARLEGTTLELSGYGAFANVFLQGTAEGEARKRLALPHTKLFRKAEMPASLHYRDNPRIGDLVLIADEGWYLVPPGGKQGPDNTRGAHGYDPNLSSMHGLFVAAGPSFRGQKKIDSIHNTSLYGLVAKILDLKPAKTRARGPEIAALLEPGARAPAESAAP